LVAGGGAGGTSVTPPVVSEGTFDIV